ncbi:formate dehydrogenase subunit delta [Gammaproteobacteria bacterium]|jgi:hypothetical protein|nr:formate dehydrogenase subunit delta [Gammaproteobacteria bacterium]|tara:strand:+ start:204 stop:437 length:234 start_codon:yes stop_codon:yes gene_type:complete
MSANKVDRLVKMINQISLNMRSNGSEDLVVSQISEHLEKFWSPAMKDLISEQEDNNVGLTPISQKAVIQLAAMRRAK